MKSRIRMGLRQPSLISLADLHLEIGTRNAAALTRKRVATRLNCLSFEKQHSTR